MNQWVETRDGKSYWYQQFDKNEMILLKQYHKTITRLTKLDMSSVFKYERNLNGQI